MLPPSLLVNQSLLVDVKHIATSAPAKVATDMKTVVYNEIQRDLSGGNRLNKHPVNLFGLNETNIQSCALNATIVLSTDNCKYSNERQSYFGKFSFEPRARRKIEEFRHVDGWKT